MGISGTGIFENDDASGVVSEVEELGIRRLRKILNLKGVTDRELREDDNLWFRIPAAAEILVAALKPDKSLGSSLEGAVERVGKAIKISDVAAAVAALERLVPIIQSTHVGDEQSHYEAWLGQVIEIYDQLQQILTAGKPAVPVGGGRVKPPSKRIKAVAGQIIAIPVEGRLAIAKVIFVSKKTKDMILIAVLGVVDRESEMSDLPRSRPLGSLYTWSTRIREGRWRVIGQEDVSAEEHQRTLRINAATRGSICLGDDVVRASRRSDEREIPLQVVAGEDNVASVAAAMASPSQPPMVNGVFTLPIIDD